MEIYDSQCSDGCCCWQCVRTQQVGVVEDLGQFKRLLEPGLHCIGWPLVCIVGRLSLRIQQLDVVCETKTKDNVFVQVRERVQSERERRERGGERRREQERAREREGKMPVRLAHAEAAASDLLILLRHLYLTARSLSHTVSLGILLGRRGGAIPCVERRRICRLLSFDRSTGSNPIVCV